MDRFGLAVIESYRVATAGTRGTRVMSRLEKFSRPFESVQVEVCSVCDQLIELIVGRV